MLEKTKTKKNIKILWLPGLGANEIMYSKIIEKLKATKLNFQHYHIQYFDVTPNTISSLEEYSEYLYKKNKMILKIHFDLVIGTSLGGMIVQILYSKKRIKSKKFIIISSCFSKNDLTILSKFSIFLAKLIPVSFRRIVQNGISFSYRFFRFYLDDVKDFCKMFKEFPTHVFFEAPLWIQKWNGIPKSEFNQFQFFFIHGTKDPLISYKKITKRRKPDWTVYKGNHILFAMFPLEISKKIIEFLNIKK